MPIGSFDDIGQLFDIDSPFGFFDIPQPLTFDDGDDGRRIPARLPLTPQPNSTGGSAPINLSALLGLGDDGELEGMGDLFKTLLALQSGGKGQDAFGSLFSGIQL